MLDSFERITDAAGRKRLHCNECKRNTIHMLEAQCKGTWSDEQVSGGSEYSIYRCGACDAVTFEKASWDSEDIYYGDEGDMETAVRTVEYPPPTSANFAFNTDHTPNGLDDLLEEMLYALAGAKLLLATVGLRMVIEFIVRDQSIKGSNLKAQINALATQVGIDDRQKKLLHRIRERGNAGAHEAAPMSVRELIAGMGIVELLLERLYNGPGRQDSLVKRAEAVFKDDIVEDEVL